MHISFEQDPSDGLSCIACGCTNARACAGGCYWVSLDPLSCSGCFDDDGEPYAVGDVESSLFGIERCPACETPTPHAPIYLSETQCHCARCHLVLSA